MKEPRAHSDRVPAEGQGTFRNCLRTFDSLPCDSQEARNRRFDVQVPNWEARPGSHPPPSLLPLPLPFGKSKTERDSRLMLPETPERGLGAGGLSGEVGAPPPGHHPSIHSPVHPSSVTQSFTQFSVTACWLGARPRVKCTENSTVRFLPLRSFRSGGVSGGGRQGAP